MKSCLLNRKSQSSSQHRDTTYIQRLNLVILFLLTSSFLFAQTIVTGKVASGDTALSGVTVQVKSTNTGTQTDANGQFSINAPSGGTLIFSYVGFTAQEVRVGNRTTINIELQPIGQQLDEVVVVGYGTQKKSNISGSVSTISAKQIASSPSPNLSNSLVGRATGIIAVQPSGAPGSDGSNILIRGIGTTGDASPIYVIDGIVRSPSDFAQLNAAEIENFTVLKDAASAAVFGVRGGNGVILVTTKRGATGKMQISFNSSYGVQERVRQAKLMNSFEFASLFNEALKNDGRPAQYTDAELQKYKDGSDPDAYPDADWHGLLKKNPMITKHDLSATGGNDKVRYATSFSFLSQDGIIPTNNFKRYNFRSNIDAQVTSSTTFTFDLSGRNEVVKNIFNDNVWIVLNNTQPNKYPTRYSNGNYPGGPSYNLIPENGYKNSQNNVFLGRLQLLQKIPFIDGLSVKLIGAYDGSFSDNKAWFYPVVPFYVRNPDGTYIKQPLPKSSLTQNNFKRNSITLESHLSYEKKLGSSNISGLLLYTQTRDVFDGISAYREAYSVNIDQLNFGASANRNNGGFAGSSARKGVVGRVNYTYNDKYILEGSFRQDASEQFAADQRWGFFPSGSAAYIISKERFLQNVNWLSFLKLRASYGILGNDRLGGERFLYLQSYNQSGVGVFGNGNVQPAIIEGRLPTSNVTWETVRKLDIGFDATLFNNKLTASVDYFFDKRSDILGRRSNSIPVIAGFNLPVENFAKVNNKGIEVALGHQNTLSNGFKYSINANITHTKSKIIFIDEPASLNPNIKLTGLPIGTPIGLQAVGLFQNQGEVDKAPRQRGNMGPGDIRMKDVNGDGQINDDDRVPIGKSNIPETIYGLNGLVNYKNFELSFLFQGAEGVNQYIAGDAAWPFIAGPGGISGLQTTLDVWRPDNPNASNPRVFVNPNNLNHAFSSFWLEDASYLRLRNVEIAYYFPKALLQKSKLVQGLRFYVNANNVFTWTKMQNWDPEIQNAGGAYYPQLRITNVGINVQF